MRKDSSSIYKIYFMGLIYKFFIVNRTKQKKKREIEEIPNYIFNIISKRKKLSHIPFNV